MVRCHKRCASILGPNQQGITVPDPTAAPAAKKKTKRTKRTKKHHKQAGEPAAKPQDERPKDEGVKPPLNLGDTIKDLLDGKLPDLNLPATPDLGDAGKLGDLGSSNDPRTDLLDFLLGP